MLQIAAGRPIAVLPCPGATGSVIRSGDSGGSSAPVTIQVLQTSTESKHILNSVLHRMFPTHNPSMYVYTEQALAQSTERVRPQRSMAMLGISAATRVLA